MKMVSGEIEVETPVVIYDYATSDDHVVGDIPIGQALAALGDPNSPSELAQRLAVAVAMLWPEMADADVFLPEKGRRCAACATRARARSCSRRCTPCGDRWPRAD